jgi:hypothetical protein
MIYKFKSKIQRDRRRKTLRLQRKILGTQNLYESK